METYFWILIFNYSSNSNNGENRGQSMKKNEDNQHMWVANKALSRQRNNGRYARSYGYAFGDNFII